MLSTFGPEIRGISPYSDGLAKALGKCTGLTLQRNDYLKAYPEFIYPASGNKPSSNKYAYLHYAKPGTWRKPLASNPDLLHIQYWSVILAHIQLGVTKQAQKRGIPVILTLHNATQHEAIPIFSWLEKKLLRTVDHIIVHTDEGKNSVINNLAIEKNKVTVIPHGIENSGFSGIQQATLADYAIARLSPEYKYLLYFGNIRYYKGVDILLDAWREIGPNHPDTRLVIAGRCWNGSNPLSILLSRLLGNSRQSQDILQNATKGKPDNTLYKLNFINENELQALIKIARYSIFPYRKFNAQSGAASKSCASGTPIITSQEGGLPLLAIDSSYVCETLTSENLAALIDKKINTWSGDLRKQQIERISPYFWEVVAEKHTQLYRKILLTG